MKAEYYIGLNKVLQDFYKQDAYPELMSNINNEIDKHGGYVRYRDLIIMENSMPFSPEYISANLRRRANTYREPRHLWVACEDRFILEHIHNGTAWLSHKIKRSESAVRHRLRYLQGLE